MQDLFRAIKNNDEEECMNILENENIDIHTKDDTILVPDAPHYRIRRASAIVIASDVGNPRIVDALILKGANLNDTDSNGMNSLMKASVYGYIDIIKLLLSNGINIHKKSNNNGSAILYASLHSQKEVVQLLLSEGASIYDETMHGNSCVDVTYNKEIKLIFEKWPITMVIIILEELSLNGDLLESNINDLQEYFGSIA